MTRDSNFQVELVIEEDNQPVFVTDPATQDMASNQLFSATDLVEQHRAVFGDDQESFKKYLDFLQLCFAEYTDYDYFDGKNTKVSFKTSQIKDFNSSSLYEPIWLNKMMIQLSSCSDESLKSFNMGYNFFIKIMQFGFFGFVDPYLFIRNAIIPENKFEVKYIGKEQKILSDITKEEIKKKFKIFCSLNEVFVKIKKYEEYLRGLKKQQYPLVVLSYEADQLATIEGSINVVKENFKKILQQFPDLCLDLSLLNPREENSQVEKWGKLFFINPYFLLVKIQQLVDKEQQKFKEEARKIDLSNPTCSLDANSLLRALVYRDYIKIKDFFYRYQSPPEIFSMEIPRINELLKHHHWLELVFKHFHYFLKVDCLDIPTKKFPESYPPNILNFIFFSGDIQAFKNALESGVSLESLKDDKLLELFLLGCDQSKKQGFLDNQYTVSFLLTYMNFGGDFNSSKKILKKFLDENLPDEKVKLENYLAKIQSFRDKLVKFRSSRAKLTERKECLKELLALSEQYIQSFDQAIVSSRKDSELHNLDLLNKFNDDFMQFNQTGFQEREYSVSSLLSFVGFIECLIQYKTIEYCFECKTDDQEFRKDLESFKKNIATILQHFSSKNSIHKRFAELSSKELEHHPQESLKRASTQKKFSKPRGSSEKEDQVETKPDPENFKETKVAFKEDDKFEEKKGASIEFAESEQLKSSQQFSKSCDEIFDRNHSLFLDIFKQPNIKQSIERFNEIYSQIEDSERQVFVKSVLGYAKIPLQVIGEDLRHPVVLKAKEFSDYIEEKFPSITEGSALSKGQETSWQKVSYASKLGKSPKTISAKF